MANRKLTAGELEHANALLNEIRARLLVLAKDDPELLFAYRRKVYKELSYDERDKPAVRKKLKTLKRKQQGGTCPLCQKQLPSRYCVLDRYDAAKGYTDANTRVICGSCDVDTQQSRGYT